MCRHGRAGRLELEQRLGELLAQAVQDTTGPARPFGKLWLIHGEAGHGLGGGYACFPAVCDGPLQGMLRIEPPKVHGVKPLLLPGLRNGAGCNPAELLRPLRA